MPETCTAEQADFRNAWQQNGTAKVAAFLSPHELDELRTAVDASYEPLRQYADDVGEGLLDGSGKRLEAA